MTTGTLPAASPGPLARIAFGCAQLLRFGLAELQCCAFAIAIFAGLTLSAVIDLPIARYDALLIYALALTGVFYLARIESGKEIAIIGLFHLAGLALEIFKVHVGSWSYPDEGFLRIGGVPLYSGFMYAAVGSYICQAYRRFHLQIGGVPMITTGLLAIAAYANFFTHHVIADLRWLIAAGFIAALWRAKVAFTVGSRRYRMPLALSFVAIGFFLWLAENGATFLGAWRYPNQAEIWQLVHAGKWGSWALLVSLSFMLVTVIQSHRAKPDKPDKPDKPTVGQIEPAAWGAGAQMSQQAS